jgi:hypothetical protein
LLSLIALAAAVLGCSEYRREPGLAPSDRSAETRLIIKFRDPAADPASAVVLNGLSRDAGLSLAYLRPLSGGAHVLRVLGETDRQVLIEGVRRLGLRRDVEYVEFDRIMRHAPSPRGHYPE